MPDDSELLRRFAADDANSESAFAEFVGRRIGFVYGTALRRTAGNAHLARDIAQAVFLVVSKKAPSLARHERLSGWLHTTTILITRRMLRDASLRRAREQEAATMNELHHTAECTAVNEFMRELLDEALVRLRKSEREIVFLRFFEDRNFAEIGARMNINEDTARKRAARALEKLRVFFSRRGVTTTAAALGAMMTAEAAVTIPAGLSASVSGAVFAGGAAASGTVLSLGSVGAFLAFMSTPKITVITAIALVIAAFSAFHEVRRERALDLSLTAGQRENASLRKQLLEAEKLARQETGAVPPIASPALDPIAAGDAFMKAYPEVREKLIAMRQATYAGMDYLACIDLNLDEVQRAEVAKIRSALASPMPLPAVNGHGRRVLVASTHDGSQMGENLRAYLGDEGAKQLAIAIAKHTIANPVTMPLAQASYFTDEPLTAQQFRELENACFDILKNGTRHTLVSDEWDVVIEKAKSFLSPSQLDTLDGLKQRAEWQRAYKQAGKSSTEKSK